MLGGGWGRPGAAGGGWGRPEASRHVHSRLVMLGKSMFSETFMIGLVSRRQHEESGLAQLYSYAEILEKVVPERFLKNTSNCFFYPKKVAYFDIL